MPTYASELQVTYAGVTVGGNTDFKIEGPVILSKAYERAFAEFNVIVAKPVEADFIADCATLEAAFRTPRGNLVVSLGASTWASLSHSGNTGFDAMPEILVSELLETGRSRLYRIRIEFGMPADNVGTSHRRFATYRVEFTPSRRRRFTISGVYTAGGGAASANYLAAIDAYAATIVSALGSGGFEKVAEQYTPTDTDKTVQFDVTWQERLWPDAGQSSALNDDAQIVNQELRVERIKEGPGDTFGSFGTGLAPAPAPGGGPVGRTQAESGGGDGGGESKTEPVRRLDHLRLTFRCSVNKTLVTDVPAKFRNTIRPALLTWIRQVNEAGAVALFHETAEFDRAEWDVVATMDMWAVNVRIIEQRITRQDNDASHGKVLVPVWDGNPDSHYVFDGKAQKLQTVTETRRVVGAPQAKDIAGTRLPPPAKWAGLSGVPISTTYDLTPVTLGYGGITVDCHDITAVTVTQFVKLYRSTGGGTPTKAGTPNQVNPPTPTRSAGAGAL